MENQLIKETIKAEQPWLSQDFVKAFEILAKNDVRQLLGGNNGKQSRISTVTL